MKINANSIQLDLEAAREEITSILNRYNIGGIVVLGNKNGGEFKIHFPEWSCIQLNPDGTAKIKINKDNVDEASATLSFMLNARDICSNYIILVEQLLSSLESKSVEIDHDVISPSDMGMSVNLN